MTSLLDACSLRARSDLVLRSSLTGLHGKWVGGEIDAAVDSGSFFRMKGEFTAIIEEAPEGGFWAICAEVPGANGQGESVQEAKDSLRDALRLIFEDRVEDMKRGLPAEAIQSVIAVG
jgi:predicted RNase H-like HicB family nuclease